MTKQVYYEDIVVGSEIPSLTKHPTSRQLVIWAAASTDYARIHYDKDFAQSQGLPGIVVHGQLACGFLGQLITDWIGEQGGLKKLLCNYRGMMFPNEALMCRGRVAKKYILDGECYVECEMWVENPKGEKAVLSTAIVTVPTKG